MINLVCILLGLGLHIVYTKLHTGTLKNAFVPARRVVIQAIDQCTVAVLQHGPTVVVLHVCLHPDTAQEHHPSVPAIFHGGLKFG